MPSLISAEPSGSAEVERGQVDAAGEPDLADEQSRDEVPGDDVEDVHADEAAREPRHLHVEQQDRHHGDGADPLDVGPEVGWAFDGSGQG